jgi:hypothetical protein
MRPVYSTGISQPPNATIFAPLSRCTEFSDVFLSVPVVSRTAALKPDKGKSTLSHGPESVNAA